MAKRLSGKTIHETGNVGDNSEFTGTDISVSGGTKRALDVINKGGLGLPSWDRVDATYPTTSSEVYTFEKDSVTVATITITYTDASKRELSSVVRT